MRVIACALIVAVLAASSLAGETKQVRFTVDTTADVHPISPYIYGVNSVLNKENPRPLARLGGNRWTAYNWENNASNAGSDWHHQNDGFLSESNTPGAAVRPAIEFAGRNHQALVVTVPMAGYVAADKQPEGDVNQTPDYLAKRFRVSKPKKDGPLLLKPDTSDAFVYQDEFVNWIEKSARVDPQQVIFYDLDNEPALWSHTHQRIHPDKLTYAEIIERTIASASTIKDLKPDAMIFGPVSYGFDGYRSLQDAPDANDRFFLEFYLAEMKKAEQHVGHRLLDVLDIHWYPEAHGTNNVRITDKDSSPETVAARLQAPRSLWDPTYTESSWITDDAIHEPIRLIPRLQQMINDNYPGTKLAITEYNYGGSSDISGALAEADALGIFGKYNVFAAAWWDLGENSDYVNAAFDMFLNYDGKGAAFGDRSVAATTSDAESTSIYASTSQADPNHVTILLINRTGEPIDGQIDVKIVEPLHAADMYQLTADAPNIAHAGSIKFDKPSITRTLPPMSVTLISLTRE